MLPDIAVSRVHAELKIIDDECYLSDLSSKFGTLVLLQNPIEIKTNETVSIQQGQNVVEVSKLVPCSCSPLSAELSEEKAAPTTEEISSTSLYFTGASTSTPISNKKEETKKEPQATFS